MKTKLITWLSYVCVCVATIIWLLNFSSLVKHSSRYRNIVQNTHTIRTCIASIDNGAGGGAWFLRSACMWYTNTDLQSTHSSLSAFSISPPPSAPIGHQFPFISTYHTQQKKQSFWNLWYYSCLLCLDTSLFLYILLLSDWGWSHCHSQYVFPVAPTGLLIQKPLLWSMLSVSATHSLSTHAVSLGKQIVLHDSP